MHAGSPSALQSQLGKAKLRNVQYIIRRGEAEIHILDFKTTWSEFQKVSQAATEQGKAEQCIFDFKTSWSELQMPSQTSPTEAKPRCVYSNLKPHGQSSRCQVRLLPPRRSRGAYTQFQNHMIRVPDAKSDCSHQGKTKVRIQSFITSPESVHSSCVR